MGIRKFSLTLTGLLVATLGLADPAIAAGCRADRVIISGDFGRAIFAVDVADEPAERSQGLMNVPSMPAMTGMIFVYERPQRATFWMHNTLIPLDMIFVDPEGRISNIHENAIPLDDTAIEGGDNILVVLEVNGGMAARLGVEIGDILQHPAFGPQAIAPCQ